jgi:hypothetical protein
LFFSHNEKSVDAGFGVWIALDADGFARTLAGAGVGGSALAAHGQSAQMADAAVALDALQAFEIHAQLAAQVAFNDVFAAEGRINLGFGQDDFGIGRADAVNVAQSDVYSLFARDFNSNNTSHKLALSLFVARIRAYNTNHALAFNDFAVLAKFFD